jgi:hypothetical protein
MSQFSRKYYKNEYTLEDRYEHPHNDVADDVVWTFWRVWGLFEYLVLILLAIIIFLLLTRNCTSSQEIIHHEVVSMAKPAMPTTSFATQSTPSSTQTTTTSSSSASSTPVAASTISQQQTKPHFAKATKPKESYFPKKVLPADPLPQVSNVDGKMLYGPLTMEEYLYFADGVEDFYPDFFDKQSRKNMDPSNTNCLDGSCVLTSKEINKQQMNAYIEWLNDTTSANYTYVQKANHYYIQEH